MKDILVICVDSLRKDYCPGYPNARVSAPALKQFANTNTRFNQAISPSIWTHEVHASLFSGLYPPEHGLHGDDEALHIDDTLGTLLSDAGYDTHLFSTSPWLAYGGIDAGWTTHTTYSPAVSPAATLKRTLAKLKGSSRTPDDRLVDSAVTHLQQSEQPTATFVHLNDLHHAYIPKRTYYDKADTNRLKTFQSARQQSEFFDDRSIYAIDAVDHVDEAFIQQLTQFYKACVHQVDALVDQLLATVSDDTTVVIYADHGENFGDDNTFSHQYSMSDALLRVPLLVRDTAGLLFKGEYSQIVQTHDLFDYLLKVAGVNGPQRSITPLTEGRDTAFASYRATPRLHDQVCEALPPTRRRPRHQKCVWTPTGKLIVYPECDGMSGDSDLLDIYQQYMEAFDVPSHTTGEELTGDAEQRLRELGYL